ncbi:hypothetical protein EAH87_05145 [Sphingomonas koreensis]|nr:hypothetical protein EAH87_05145 [Sphingomonas koreensis]
MFDTPAKAAPETAARLVHCGTDTCLRLDGHRLSAATEVWIDGHELAVSGGRKWHAIVPLSAARGWAVGSGYCVRISLIDPITARQTSSMAALPPGALGPPLELASFVVRAH